MATPEGKDIKKEGENHLGLPTYHFGMMETLLSRICTVPEIGVFSNLYCFLVQAMSHERSGVLSCWAAKLLYTAVLL